MTIDVQEITAWLGQLSIILGVLAAAYKLIDRHLLKRLAELEKRMSDVEHWTGKQQEDILDGAERDRIIIDGVLACLKGLQEKGCNGPVTEAVKSIDAYVNGKAYKTASKQMKVKGD